MEPAGVALGGLALVSLFSSCVECLDLLERGRNYTRDVHIAATKLRLLRQRLQAWGKTHNIHDSDAEDRLEDAFPQQTDDSLVIESLLGIKGLLSDTSHLCTKYSLETSNLPRRSNCGGHASSLVADGTPIRQGNHRLGDGVQGAGRSRARCDWIFTSQRPKSSDNLKQFRPDVACQCSPFGTNPPHTRPTTISYKPPMSRCSTATVPRSARLFRLKFSWAVFDRRQFEALIVDLDFLVTNLEKISPLAMATPPPRTPHDLQHTKPDWATTAPRQSVSSSSFGSAMPRQCKSRKPRPTQATGSSSSGSMVRYEGPSDSVKSTSSGADDAVKVSLTSDQSQASGITVTDHLDNVTQDNAKINSGQMGDKAPPCRVTVTGNEARDESRQFSGTATDEMAKLILS